MLPGPSLPPTDPVRSVDVGTHQVPDHIMPVGLSKAAAERSAPLVDETVDDIETRYEFLDELGTGASAAVFLARRRTTGQECAIKVTGRGRG